MSLAWFHGVSPNVYLLTDLAFQFFLSTVVLPKDPLHGKLEEVQKLRGVAKRCKIEQGLGSSWPGGVQILVPRPALYKPLW